MVTCTFQPISIWERLPVIKVIKILALFEGECFGLVVVFLFDLYFFSAVTVYLE